MFGRHRLLEDSVVSGLYRDLLVNSIWEGSGSVMCLDLLRVLTRSSDSVESTMAYLAAYCGHDASDRQVYEKLGTHLVRGTLLESKGRWLTETLAKLHLATSTIDRSTPLLAEAYIRTR